MVGRALAAAERLASEGIDLEVIDLRSIRPIDTATIIGSACKTGNPEPSEVMSAGHFSVPFGVPAAQSRPSAAESLNERSPRPPTS